MSVRNLLAQLPYHRLRVDLTGTPITTAAWVQLSAALPKACTAMQVYYSGDAILRISKGDATQEEVGTNEIPIYITPGGEGNMVPIELPKGARLSARAVDQDVAVGELVINFFG